MTNALPVILGFAMSIGGVAIVLHSLRKLPAARAASQWPAVVGRILESEVVELGTSPGGHACNIRYRYAVNGKEYESDRVSFFGVWTRAEAEELARRFAVGTDHPVHHDPREPASAVLVPGVYGKSKTHGVAMGIIAAIAGAGVIAGNV